MERKWARPREEHAEEASNAAHVHDRAGDRGGERRQSEEAGRQRRSKKSSHSKASSRSRSNSSSRGRSSSTSSSSSSSSTSSSSCSSSSSSSSDGRRRRSKHKHRSRKDKSTKSKKSKDSRKSNSQKHDRKSKKDKKDKKDKRDKKDKKDSTDRTQQKGSSKHADRLFYARNKYLLPAAAATRLQRIVRGHKVRLWSSPTLRRVRAQRKAVTAELNELVRFQRKWHFSLFTSNE